MGMKASYDEKKNQFILLWKDEVKVFNGVKYPHTRQKETWKGAKKPTKREIAAKIAELLKEGEALEKASQLEVQKLKNELKEQGVIFESEENKNEIVNALHYFITLDAAKLCKTEKTNTIRNCAKVIRMFGEWLKANHPSLPLHEIATYHMQDFFGSIADYSTGTQRHFYIYLNKIFNKILIDFEKSKIKYINPFARYTKKDFITENPVLKKKPFSVEQIIGIIEHIVAEKEQQTGIWGSIQMQQKFFIFYMLIVTGWRIGDILTLTWEQINFEKRTISLMHMKTETRTQFETVIFITSLMEKVLKQQKENAKHHPFNTHLVFNIRKTCEEITNYEYYNKNLNDYLLEVLQEMGILVSKTSKKGREQHNFGIHSFRKSAITELHLTSLYSTERIHYLVGHVDNSTEGQSYLALLMYPERSTRSMIEHLETVTKLEFFYNKLLFGAEKAHTDEAVANVWLSPAEINELKMNFWTDEAIERLRVAWEKGTNIKVIQTAIFACNNQRLKNADRDVSLQNVEDVLQMLEWVNADAAVKKILENKNQTLVAL